MLLISLRFLSLFLDFFEEGGGGGGPNPKSLSSV